MTIPADLQSLDELLLAPGADAWRPFEERAQLAGAQAAEDDVVRARAAARVVRLLVRATESGVAALDAFRWQVTQAKRLLAELPARDPEGAHLMGVLHAASGARRLAVLRLGILAYADFLERGGRFEEALAVIGVAARLRADTLTAGDVARLALLAGRLHLALVEHERAERAFTLARAAACAAEDGQALFRARIGLAQLERRRGDVTHSRSGLESLVAEAAGGAFADVRGEAYLELGAAFAAEGRPADALDATYRAFAHAGTEPQRVRVLAELARMLRTAGAPAAARVAYELVASGTSEAPLRAVAALGMLDADSSIGDRLAFERSRRDAFLLSAGLPAPYLVELHFTLGVGYARFRRLPRAHAELATAAALAQAAGLHGWSATITRVVEGLEGCPTGPAAAAPELPPVVRRVASGLAAIAAVRSA